MGPQIIVRPYRTADEDAVPALWQACERMRPQNDPRRDIARKLHVNPERFPVGEFGGRIVAGASAGRPWPGRSGACAPPAVRRSKLQVRAENTGVIEFYRRLGFSVDATVSVGKRREHDQPV